MARFAQKSDLILISGQQGNQRDMQQLKNNSLYGGACLALLSLTTGCGSPSDSSSSSVAHTASQDPSKTAEAPPARATQPGHQRIVDNLTQAERLLEQFEQATERVPLEGLKMGSHEISPELAKVADQLLTDLVNPELGLTGTQSAVLENTVESLKVVASLLQVEEVRPKVFFSNVRSEERNVAWLKQAGARLQIAKAFFAGPSTIVPR